MRVYRLAASYWFFLAATATLAGVAREMWLVPRIGELRAHQLGTLVVCVLFIAIIHGFVRHGNPSPVQATTIGITWVVVAAAFELGFGRYVDGLPWRRLLSDYDVSRGRLLLLVWLTVAIAPVVFARGIRQHTSR